jgi:negative regulator of sigma E activity
MDIDSRLREAGQRWRASQGPSLEHPSPASLEDDAPTRKWWKGLVPLAAAAAAAGIIFGIVSLHGASTNGQQVPAGTTTHPSLVTSPLPSHRRRHLHTLPAPSPHRPPPVLVLSSVLL